MVSKPEWVWGLEKSSNRTPWGHCQRGQGSSQSLEPAAFTWHSCGQPAQGWLAVTLGREGSQGGSTKKAPFPQPRAFFQQASPVPSWAFSSQGPRSGQVNCCVCVAVNPKCSACPRGEGWHSHASPARGTGPCQQLPLPWAALALSPCRAGHGTRQNSGGAGQQLPP